MFENTNIYMWDSFVILTVFYQLSYIFEALSFVDLLF